MSEFIATADADQVVTELTPEKLRVVLRDAARSVSVTNPDRRPTTAAAATRLDGEAWRVEVRGDDPPEGVWTTAANTDAVFDLLRSWAAADDWWREAFGWQPIER